MEAVVDLRTEEFAEQNKLLDLLAQIAQEKVEVDTANFPLFSEPFTNSEKVPTTPIQVEQLLDIVILVAEFLEENEIVEKAKSLKDFLEYLKSKGLNMQELDITENILLLKVHLLKNLAEQAISKIKEPIEQTERKVQIFVSTKVNGLVDTAMLSATQLMNNTFEQARPSLLALSPEDSIFIDKSISVAKKSIVGNIDRAVKDAVDKKVVDAINNFIHTALAERLYGLVDSIVGNSLYSLAEGEKPDLSNVSDELSDALEDIEQDVLKFISFDNIGRMLKYTALIAWDDVDMGKIIGDILQELPRKKLQTCRAKAPE
ncbi:MAG: hypothetical protein LBH34_00820, partial [Prevotellaceae bacterium]|jgi:hypothetical protein|nr:hypothetical protein [Prevotellaceae bacterium]